MTFELDEEQFGSFFKEKFINVMTPRIIEMNIAFEISTPFDKAEDLIATARENIEYANEMADDNIHDLDIYKDFIKEEIEATAAIIRREDFDVKLVIRVSDSPRIRRTTA